MVQKFWDKFQGVQSTSFSMNFEILYLSGSRYSEQYLFEA